MIKNFFAAPTDNGCAASNQDHQHPAFLPQSRPAQNQEGYPESPDFNKTQKAPAMPRMMTKTTELGSLNAFDGETDGAGQ